MNKLEQIQKLQEEFTAISLKLEALVAVQEKEKESKPKIDWRKIPIGTLVLAQDVYSRKLTGYYRGYHGKNYGVYSYTIFSGGATLRSHTACHPSVMVTQIKLLQSDWIVWQGGECPLPEGVMVKVILRKGDMSSAGDATLFKWGHDKHSNDIIAYQIQESDWYN